MHGGSGLSYSGGNSHGYGQEDLRKPKKGSNNISRGGKMQNIKLSNPNKKKKQQKVNSKSSSAYPMSTFLDKNIVFSQDDIEKNQPDK